MSKVVAFVALCSFFLLDLPLAGPAAAQVAGCQPANQGSNANVCAPAVRVLRNLPYVQPLDPARTGDLYLPETPSGALRPAVVVIHGGAWVGGNDRAADTVFLSRTLAQHGYVAFNINYRLVNRGGNFPYDVQDVKDAIAFLALYARQWNVDAHRIAVTGTSAGGHLSLMAGYTPNSGIFAAPHYPSSRVRVVAVGDFFGPTDLAVLQSSGPDVAQNAVKGYVQGLCSEEPDVCREASPVTYIGTAVPTLIEHGTADQVVPFAQSQELAGRLKQRGVPAQLVPVPGGQHGLLLGRPGQQRIDEVNKLLAFLRTALHCGNACE